MIQRITSLLAVIAVLAATPALAQTKTFKLLSSWDRSSYAALEPVLIFQEQLTKLSGGKLATDLKGPETVPPFQQIQPVSAGVFDMLHTHGVYHAGSKGLALVMDAIEPDLDKRRSSGVWEQIDKYYQKHNKVKLVSMPVTGTQGYQIVLRDPLTAEGDFKGRKIRGTQTYFGLIKALGGTPVVLPGAEVYPGLEKGLVDGAAWPASGIYTMKWHEVAKYRMRPTFGTSNTVILVNMGVWQKLSAAEQKMLLDAGRQAETVMLKQGDETLAKEEAELNKLGMKYTQLPPDKVKIVRELWGTSLWEVAEQCCADGTKALREAARKANLSN